MNKFQILVEGYAKPSKDGKSFFASCTSTLIQNNDKNILVDPGADKAKLIDGLKQLDLKIQDIDILFLTHWHPDHFLNIQLFPNVDIIDSTTIWKNTGEEIFPNDGSVIDRIQGTDVKVIATPGHREEHVSLLFEDDDKGLICVAQDVFWWEDGDQPDSPTVEQLMNIEDPYLANSDELQKSRELVLNSGCKWIIPGHGTIFKNPNDV